jgi:hypothetical protein
MVKELVINGTPTKYRITSSGDVLCNGKTMATYHCRKGYRRIKLIVNGERKAYNVARVVAATFLGIAPDGMQVNHKDRNKQNDNAANLEYVTNTQNTIHSIDKSKTTSKYNNVYSLPNGRWRAWYRSDGRQIAIGTYATENLAYMAYLNSTTIWRMADKAVMIPMAQ